MNNLAEQDIWMFFLNKPISEEETRQYISSIEVEEVIIRENDLTHPWHSIQLVDFPEVNKLRTTLLLENLQVRRVCTDSGRWYFDVKR